MTKFANLNIAMREFANVTWSCLTSFNLLKKQMDVNCTKLRILCKFRELWCWNSRIWYWNSRNHVFLLVQNGVWFQIMSVQSVLPSEPEHTCNIRGPKLIIHTTKERILTNGFRMVDLAQNDHGVKLPGFLVVVMPTKPAQTKTWWFGARSIPYNGPKRPVNIFCHFIAGLYLFSKSLHNNHKITKLIVWIWMCRNKTMGQNFI